MWLLEKEAGLEYYYHPFFDKTSFYSPERRSRIFVNSDKAYPIQSCSKQYEEKYCAFCLGELAQATPEKERIIRQGNALQTIIYPDLTPPYDQEVLFRRQGNLFEIISYQYWKEKYGLSISPENKERLDKAFEDPLQRESLEDLVRIKSLRMGIDSEFQTIQEIKSMCESFYSGYHELITSGSHYLPHATKSSELFHSGYIPYEDHRISYQMICRTLKDMVEKNPFITYIAVFQNWLSLAGASFEHWHKQIIGLDYWGLPLEREAEQAKTNPAIYRDFVHEIALKRDLYVAENEYAIAYVEIGGKTGQITICSKSKNLRPYEHTTDEIDGMSDLSHAIIRSLTPLTPYNEEWFFTPFNSEFRTPWRVIINLRTTTSAGLENISRISVNPISISELALATRIHLEEAKKDIASDISIHPKNISKNIFQYISQK